MNETGKSTEAGAKPKVVLERTYKATPEEMWALWTTKDGFESWWGPEGFRVEVGRLEARSGGALDYDMIADAPEQIEAMKKMGQPVSHGTHGKFSEFRPHERLSIAHMIDFLPGVTPYENITTVDFIRSGDRVRMVITLDALHDAHWTKMASMGWTSQLTKLDKRFS